MFSRHIQKAAFATSALRRTDGPPEIISALHGSASTANITIKDANLRNIKNYGNKDTMIQKKVSNKRKTIVEGVKTESTCLKKQIKVSTQKLTLQKSFDKT